MVKIVQVYIKLKHINAIDDRLLYLYERSRCVN